MERAALPGRVPLNFLEGRYIFRGTVKRDLKISWERRWGGGLDERRRGWKAGWSSWSLPLLIRHVRWELQKDSVEPFADWLKRSETLIVPLLQTIRVLWT